jgi:hypothetical protein
MVQAFRIGDGKGGILKRREEAGVGLQVAGDTGGYGGGGGSGGEESASGEVTRHR